VEVNGISKKPLSVIVDGQAAAFSASDHSVTVMARDLGKGMNLVIPSVAY
jgi:hypothetical protein